MQQSDQSIITLTWADPVNGDQQTYSGVLPVTIGRRQDNQIPLQSSQISREHARLSWGEDGRVLLEDRGSRNGILVDGTRVEQATLGDGDSFRIRPFDLTLKLGGISAPPALRHVLIATIRWTDPENPHVNTRRLEPPIQIGRHSSCTIHLSGKQISRQHALIEQRNGDLWVINQDSRNGIYVDNKQVKEQVLRVGSVLRLGNYNLHIEKIESQNVEDVTGKRGISYEDEQTVIAFNPLDDLSNTPHTIEEPWTHIAGMNYRQVPISELHKSGLPMTETTYLAVGGGLGSFSWVDMLRIGGVPASEIISIGNRSRPYGRYRQLCRNSQIPDWERLRSNSDSCPDNMWGWPGYAVREIWQDIVKGDIPSALRTAWQIFGEPTFSETYTPRSGTVFDSIDREAQRIKWGDIWRRGYVRAIRQTDDGRYVVLYSGQEPGTEKQMYLVLATYLHLAVGYPAIRFLPDLCDYRMESEDTSRVVNAYEKHDHVYDSLQKNGGTVLVRGRGIVASRIFQRIFEVRRENTKVSVLHLMRSPTPVGNTYGRTQRSVKNHWEYQPFNWPKAAWGGDLKELLEDSTDPVRNSLLNDWGGTTTADRTDWQDIVQAGLNEGWYQRAFGKVRDVNFDPSTGKISTNIQESTYIQKESKLEADFVIDATGLESSIDDHPLLRDLATQYNLKRNPKMRLAVSNAFEVEGMRNNHRGRFYASGVATLGGPYAAVDSFLGLQYAALASVDNLVSIGAPHLRSIDGVYSLLQWIRWARGAEL